MNQVASKTQCRRSIAGQSIGTRALGSPSPSLLGSRQPHLLKSCNVVLIHICHASICGARPDLCAPCQSCGCTDQRDQAEFPGNEARARRSEVILEAHICAGNGAPAPRGEHVEGLLLAVVPLVAHLLQRRDGVEFGVKEVRIVLLVAVVAGDAPAAVEALLREVANLRVIVRRPILSSRISLPVWPIGLGVLLLSLVLVVLLLLVELLLFLCTQEATTCRWQPSTEGFSARVGVQGHAGLGSLPWLSSLSSSSESSSIALLGMKSSSSAILPTGLLEIKVCIDHEVKRPLNECMFCPANLPLRTLLQKHSCLARGRTWYAQVTCCLHCG